MKLAILPRYLELKEKGMCPYKHYVNHDFELMAQKLGIGLCAIMSPYEFEDICEVCDGLIIPGSNNGVNPSYYGEGNGEPYPDYDEYTLDSKVIDYFFKNNKPIMGICAGHQALNIYFGGNVRYVTDDGTKPHCNTIHHINVKSDSFVYEAFKSESAEINSYHIMRVGKLGKDLEVVAKSDDGIIEAIQHKEKPVFGVQWHPEKSFRDERTVEWNLFENFLERCRK